LRIAHESITFTSLKVIFLGTANITNTYVFTLRVNNVNSSLVCNLASGVSSGSGSGSVSVAAGDRIDILIAITGTDPTVSTNYVRVDLL